MDRFGLWSIPFVVILLSAGEVSRRVLDPLLRSLQPEWPGWLVTLLAPLPGLILVGSIGYLLFRRADPSRHNQT